MNQLQQALNFITASGDPIKATGRIATIGAVLVILAAAALGYRALYDLFLSIGLFGPGLAWLFPLLFDLAEITAALIVLNAKLQGEDDRLAWRAVLAFTALGIIANISHAIFAAYQGEITKPQAILGVIFTALFPISVALITHLLKNVIARNISRNSTIKTITKLTHDLQEAQQALSETKATHQAKTAEIEALELKIEALKVEARAAAKVETVAPHTAVQAGQLDALLMAGWTLKDSAAAVGVSEGTARNRLGLLNGNALSQRGS